MTLPPMSSSVWRLHTQHKQRLEKFAAAAARHAENIRAQREAARLAREEVIRAAISAVAQAGREKSAAIAAASRRAGPPAKAGCPINRIQSVVAARYGVTVIDLKSAWKSPDVALPRHVAMYLAKALTSRSYPEIGRRFGGRDGSTVFQSVRKIESLIACDVVMAATLSALRESLE